MKFQDLLERLQELDLMLSTDARFPSVTSLVVGEGVRGSWWALPQAHDVFRLDCELHDHPDVLIVKLISGKVTFVHRPLWPAVYAVATARDPWQMRGLSKEAKALLKRVDKESRCSASGDPVRELEARLLVQSESVHTDRGSHSKFVQTWESWGARARLGVVKLSAAEGRSQLERVVERLNKQFGAKGTLPWEKQSSRGSRP